MVWLAPNLIVEVKRARSRHDIHIDTQARMQCNDKFSAAASRVNDLTCLW